MGDVISASTTSKNIIVKSVKDPVFASTTSKNILVHFVLVKMRASFALFRL